MKKLLLSTAAVGLVMVATPAQAQLTLELGGWMKGYAFYTDQDDDLATGAGEARDFDIVRQTEIHMGGETTLDNGLTVGFHLEAEADGDTGAQEYAGAGTTVDNFEVEESYAYFSGGWGRVNFGAEDGASYLLQVAAPAGDDNVDGIRQFVNPVNYGAMPAGLAPLGVNGARGGLDYDQDLSGYADKITYLSPIMNGFQLGASYTPDVLDASTEDAANLNDVDDTYGAAYEIAARYEGMFNNVGVILGGGYTHVDLENDGAAGAGPEDDRTAWNVGLDLDIGPFGIGAAYMEDDYGEGLSAAGITGTGSTDDEEETFVVGADYTTGPFKLGVSYLDIENTHDIPGVGGDGIESQRYTGGVVYTYGPGMTFRGSISHVEHEDVVSANSGGDDDFEATSILLGTQINF